MSPAPTATISANPETAPSFDGDAAEGKLLEPRWERRKDARPTELTHAALDLFVERGYTATRLDDVAKRAGVSKGTLYLYFDSKEALFKSVIQEGFVSQMAEAADIIAAHQGSSADLLRHIMRLWWERIGSTKFAGITKLMLSEAGNFPELANFYHENVVARGTGLFAAIIQRGITSGEFRPVALDVIPRIVCAPVVMLMLWRFSFDKCGGGAQAEPQHYLETHIDLLIHGLLAEPPATPFTRHT